MSQFRNGTVQQKIPVWISNGTEIFGRIFSTNMGRARVIVLHCKLVKKVVLVRHWKFQVQKCQQEFLIERKATRLLRRAGKAQGQKITRVVKELSLGECLFLVCWFCSLLIKLRCEGAWKRPSWKCLQFKQRVPMVSCSLRRHMIRRQSHAPFSFEWWLFYFTSVPHSDDFIKFVIS